MAWRGFYKGKMYRVVGWDSQVHLDEPYCDVISVDEKEVVLMEFIEVGGKAFHENDICSGIKCHSDKKFVIRRRRDEEFVGFLPVELHKKGISTSVFVRWDDLKIIGNALENPEMLEGVPLNSL